MKYEIIIDLEKFKAFEVEGRYIEAIKMLIADVRFNLERLNQSNEELQEIYFSISYLGEDSGKSKEYNENLLSFVKVRRAFFIISFSKM